MLERWNGTLTRLEQALTRWAPAALGAFVRGLESTKVLPVGGAYLPSDAALDPRAGGVGGGK